MQQRAQASVTVTYSSGNTLTCNANDTENLVKRKVRSVFRFMWAKRILSDEDRRRLTDMNCDGAVRAQRGTILILYH